MIYLVLGETCTGRLKLRWWPSAWWDVPSGYCLHSFGGVGWSGDHKLCNNSGNCGIVSMEAKRLVLLPGWAMLLFHKDKLNISLKLCLRIDWIQIFRVPCTQKYVLLHSLEPTLAYLSAGWQHNLPVVTLSCCLCLYIFLLAARSSSPATSWWDINVNKQINE